MGRLYSTLAGIDSINEWLGKVVRWVPPMAMLATSYEVVMRYLFDRPTLWAMEVCQYLLLTCVAIGGGYAVLHGAHVRVDIMVKRLGTRGKAIMELVVTSLLLLFLSIVVYQVFQMAAFSISIMERQMLSPLQTPMYPIKAILFAGVLVTLLQAIAKFIRDLVTAVTGKSDGEITASSESKG